MRRSMPDSARLHEVEHGHFVKPLMPSFRQVIDQHAPVLLVDACSARIQVGWLSADAPPRWAFSDEEAGIGLFKCLETIQASPMRAGAYVFSDGPGSLLGIRTTAMAVRTWHVLNPRPIFSYHSLEVIAHFLRQPAVTIIADARRDAWHCCSLASGLSRVPTTELAGELVMPDNFRNWTSLPADTKRVPYSLPEMLPSLLDDKLLRSTKDPDAFLHEEPSYVTWTPRIHRAPA